MPNKDNMVFVDTADYDAGYKQGLIDGHAVTVERIRMAVWGLDKLTIGVETIENILNKEEISIDQ